MNQGSVEEAWPTLFEASKMLRVSVAQLKQSNALLTPAGGVSHVRPREVLRLAKHYGHIVLNEVAAEMITHVEIRSPQWAVNVEEEIDEFLVANRLTLQSSGALVEVAKQHLPSKLAKAVNREIEPQAEPTITARSAASKG